MKILCLAVPRKKAEEIRKKLIEKNLLLQNYKIKRNKNYVYFPIKEKIKVEGCEILEEEFEEIRKKSYEDILREKGIDLESIAIDFIGDIAVIKLKNEDIAKEVANAIIKTNKHVKTVCLDRGVKEDFRIRDLEIILGESTETTHKEYGIKMKLDIKKVYFSPRLAAERMRVAKQVKENEIVIDMFAGIAPFSLIIAKFAKPKKIYAIDKNPWAIKYARENVRINKMEEIIEVIEGDAKNILPKLPKAHHIIMNLPHKSHEFLPLALEKGKILHYYEIVERNKIKERVEEIKERAKNLDYEIEIKNLRIIGSYSPSKVKIGMEIIT